MREIDGDPEEQTVADRYSAGLELCVVRGTYVGESPAGYDGADHLEYEQGDRLPKDRVTLAAFGSATNLTLLHPGGKVAAGAGIGDLDRNGDETVREYGVGGGGDNFHPEDFETDDDGDGEQNAERGDGGQFTADAEGD